MTAPTTHNALPHAQRLRLMRSMHKLEAVLGETPLVVELASRSPSISPLHGRSFSVAGRTQPRIYTPSERTSSLRRAASTKHGQDIRPMLFIDVPPPSASLLSPPLSPLTPSTDNIPSTSDRDRRRKLAKLTRTLGENVPPSLVFPEQADQRLVKNRRRASTLTSQVPEIAAGWDKAAAPRVSTDSHSSSASGSSSHHAAPTYTHSSLEHLLPPATTTNTHRSEKGWSGEWSGPGNMRMDQVVKGLRGLKMK
ncbi:hypothetical protein C8F01DRAFT_1362357 [Mycena amicta]|nr:hypothetical protein C8F01DRAFT_1362357 [Mycena amicta]